MGPIGWILIGLALLVGVVHVITNRHPSHLRRRQDTQGEWRAAGCSADAVDKLLEVACEAFGFSRRMKFKLRPDDTAIGLYRIVYPRTALADQLEIETFLLTLDEDLGVQAEGIGPDTSLAEIARRIDTRQQPASCS